MQLVWNWRDILKRAWSIRLIVLAGLLSGVEVALPLLPISIPDGAFAALSFLVVVAAFIARLIAQRGLSR